LHQRPRTRWSFRAWRQRPWLAALDSAAFLALAVALAAVLRTDSGASGYAWHWGRVPVYLFDVETGDPGPLLEGLFVTLTVCAWSLGLALAFGLLGALGRLGGSFLGRALARGYIETVRNTPLLIQIFLIYFVLGPVLDIPRFPAAVLSLALFEGAYIAEILRAGIVGIHQGQWEAALSLGLTEAQAYRRIILPQAVRRVLPPLAGQTVTLVKDSALVSVIAVYDLTMRGRTVISDTFLTFEIWFTVAAMYLVLTLALSLCSRYLERRLEVSA